MVQVHKGKITGKNLKIAIVISRFNEFITNSLLKGTLDCLEQHFTDLNAVEVFWVPGSFEIAQMAQSVAKRGNIDGMICLGAVIRGETPHFDYIAAETTKGIGQVGLQSDIPVVYGVLTTDTVEQAIDRAGTKSGNKGWEAALTLLEMSGLMKSLKK